MINGLYTNIYNGLKNELNKSNRLKLWICYFYMTNDFTSKSELFDIKPTFITFDKYCFDKKVFYIKTNQTTKIDIDELNNDYLFLSEDENNCINAYNNLIYNSIDLLGKEMNLLRQRYDTIVEQITYSKNCFIDTDYFMEKLTH